MGYKKYNIVGDIRNVLFSFDTKTECRDFIVSKLGSNISTNEKKRWFLMYQKLMFKGYRFIEYDPMSWELNMVS